ncbi:membrane-spanning 4-domains subfamily A member 4A-like isoform X3 [Aquarana catesbeiana]|uniref:membrane-spanning 4-domains subfamily A member 4A-like isoform X3 n=1 Tax=Aquarana catesbeiana TaxID=8400 RepID=UPI003CCA4E83
MECQCSFATSSTFNHFSSDLSEREAFCTGLGQVPDVGARGGTTRDRLSLLDVEHCFGIAAKWIRQSVVLICAGTFNVIMGIGMIFSVYGLSLISGNPFWAAVAYIITGIMTLSAYSKISICRVRGSLAMNVVSALMSGVGIVLACLDLVPMSFPRCRQYSSYYCSENVSIVVHSLTLVNNLLIFCVSISLGVYGCLSLDDVPSIQQVFLLHNGAMVPVSVAATTSPPLTQYPIPNFVQGHVNNQPTITITQSP